jgi:hypothetical protein
MQQAFKAIYLQRIDACKSCPSLIKLVSVCRECGCVVPMKAAVPGASCPSDKWPKEIESLK